MSFKRGLVVTSRRVARVQDRVREEISRLLLFKVKDPRLRAVTVTSVRMTADLKQAMVHYGVFDDEIERGEVQRGLERATGFIRREVGRALGLKFVPQIGFEFDRSLEYAQHMEQVFKRLKETSGTGSDDESA